MRVHTFQQRVLVPRQPHEVFPFFSDPFNLDAITPPWLDFRIVTPPPIEMRVGTLIDYRLKVRGIPLRWRSKITAWEPPHRFVDEQVAGPYRLWIHEHTFETSDGGTLIGDRVRYAVPFDFVLNTLFVRRDVAKIFAYREERLEEVFAVARESGATSRAKPAPGDAAKRSAPGEERGGSARRAE